MSRRPLASPVAVCLLCAFGLAACAGDKNKISWEQDKPAVTSSIQHMQTEQQRLAGLVQLQAARIDGFAARMDGLAPLSQQFQLQQAQIQALSVKLQNLPRQKAEPSNKARPFLRKRVKKAGKQPARSVLKPQLAAVSVVPVVDKAAQADAEKNAYTAAYLALKSGRYDEAAKGFRQQLNLYPKGQYTDQAWYWLGETRLAQHERSKALIAFKYVADHYPNSVKHAAALFRMARISVDLKQNARAIQYYKQLIREHADSDLAEQARTALKALENPLASSQGRQ